jgi:hypothetical protein
VGGVRTLFYEEAEEVLSHLPRLGVGLIMHKTRAGGRLWDNMSMARLVRRLREQLELPAFFTLDACRHGGMTELEEAEPTDGQGRALSAHKSKAYALAATRKRHAHRLALAEDSDSDSERTAGESRGDMHPARRPS